MAIYKKEYVLNGEVTGELLYSKDTTGWVGGFSSQNTWRIKEVFSPTADQSFEVSVRVRTGSSISSPNIQEIFAIGVPLLMRIDANKLALSYNTGSWSVVGSYSCSTNTEYLTVLKYNPITTTTNGYTYSAKYLYFEIYNSSGDLLHRSSASLNSRFLNFVGDFAYLGSQEGGENWGGRIHNGEDTYIKVDGELWWQPLKEELIDVSGSVKISRGYYSDGVNEIVLGTKDYNIDALTSGQTTGGKNKLFVYKDTSDNTGALLASTTPTGDFKITKDLEHPVYLSNLKNYISGDTLQMGEVTFSSADAEIWVQPILTSATSYGAVTDSRKSTDEAGWKALDGNSSTQYVPGTGTAWWKWELPEYVIFTPESSITWTHRNNSETFKGTMCRFFADETMSIRLTPDFTDTNSSLSSVTVPCSDITEPVTTNVIYWTKDSGGSWGGASSITFNKVYKGTALFLGVRIGKTLQYSESQDKTYWIPKQISVPLSDIVSTQSVGTVNRLYLTLKGDVTSISFSNNGVINGVDSYMATGLNVYLSDDLTKILNIGE